MSFYRLLLQRSLRSFSHSHTTPQNPLLFLSTRSFAFSSAEEAAAERRHRKRLFLMERPLHTLRGDPGPQPLPDTISSLVGPRKILHLRVESLIYRGDLDSASATACQAVSSNTRPTPHVFTCNTVMDYMRRVGRLEDVVALFRFFFQESNIVPDITSYTILIDTHCEAGRVDTALEVFQHILAHTTLSRTSFAANYIIKGLIDANRISEAVNVLREMLNRGDGRDYRVYQTLIRGFIKLGNVEKALELFDEIRGDCIVSDNDLVDTFMYGYFEVGMAYEARSLYHSLVHDQLFNGGFKKKLTDNILFYNALLEVLLRYGEMNHALVLFDHMLTAHNPPHFSTLDTDSYNLMVNEYCRLRKFDEAVAVFKKTEKKPCVMDVECYNNIIGKLCAENGWVSEAENLFDEMPGKSVKPNVSTYGFFIDVYLRDGRMDDVLRLFGKMVGEAGLKVDVCFYNKVFDGLVGKGRTEEAMEIYRKMAERELKPDSRSYEILITGLCREGGLDQSLHLLEEMVNNRVVLSPTICEVAFDAFGKAGRSIEVERLLQDKTETIADPQAVTS